MRYSFDLHTIQSFVLIQRHLLYCRVVVVVVGVVVDVDVPQNVFTALFTLRVEVVHLFFQMVKGTFHFTHTSLHAGYLSSLHGREAVVLLTHTSVEGCNVLFDTLAR